jgi:hypothetical protein
MTYLKFTLTEETCDYCTGRHIQERSKLTLTLKVSQNALRDVYVVFLLQIWYTIQPKSIQTTGSIRSLMDI